jgi:hypothetical protein
MIDQLRGVGRLLVGPLSVGVFAGVELLRYGAIMAAAGAYLVFLGAQFALVQWTSFQLRRERRRLEARRGRLR